MTGIEELLEAALRRAIRAEDALFRIFLETGKPFTEATDPLLQIADLQRRVKMLEWLTLPKYPAQECSNPMHTVKQTATRLIGCRKHGEIRYSGLCNTCNPPEGSYVVPIAPESPEL